MQELVREVRKEMNSTTSGAGAGGGQEDQEELCFEVIATVLEIFGRMDSLVGGVYFHFHSHCDTHRRSSALTNKDLAKRLLSPHTLLSHQYGDYFLRKIQGAPPPRLVIAWQLAQCPTTLARLCRRNSQASLLIVYKPVVPRVGFYMLFTLMKYQP